MQDSEKPSRPSVRFVTRKWPPAMGGMETWSVRMVEGLSSRTNLELLKLPGNRDGSAPGPLSLLGFALSASIHLLLRPPPDVTHIGDMASWPLALVARIRSRRTGIVLSAHGTDVQYARRPDWKGRLYARYLTVGARWLGNPLVIANSAFTASAANSAGFSNSLVVPLATDSDEPGALDVDCDTILFAGRLTPRKGCAWFIREVLPRLPAPITLRVAGTVWDEAEAAALDNPRVRYLGHLGREQLYREYAKALAVVLPNIDVPTAEGEGFGLIAVEASGAGGIPIAAARDGLVDAVRNGQTGFLLPSGDAAQWACCIMDIREWSERRRLDFIEQSRDHIRKHHSWNAVVESTLRIYRTRVRRCDH